MLKILLINPSKKSKVNFDSLPSYPLGLLYLGAVLKEAGHKVRIFDLAILETQYSDLNRLILKYKPDLIGISAVSVYYNEMKRVCKAISINKIPIVLGGVHPSCLPELTLNESNADFLVIGEGEATLLQLVEYIEKGGNLEKIPGIAYKKDGKIIINEKRELIKNIDKIPFPAWELINLKDYNPVFKSGYKGFFDYTNFLPIITTRGCPYRCGFCASTNFWGSQIRSRSVKNIIGEIEYDIQHYNIRTFEIWDDNFTFNKKRVIDFCKEIINRKISAKFYLPNSIRLDTLNRPLIKLLKLAGFKAVAISPESGSQKLLDLVNKRLDLRIVKKVAKMLQEERIITIAYFMLGLPGETFTTAHKTIKFAASLPINGVSFFIFTPLPGSTLYDVWVKDKDMKEIIWSTNFLGKQNFEKKVISKLSLKQIKQFRVLGLIVFITRIDNFFRWIRRFDIHNVKPIILSARRTYFSLIKNLFFLK